jgi:hypothetical protein
MDAARKPAHVVHRVRDHGCGRGQLLARFARLWRQDLIDTAQPQ